MRHKNHQLDCIDIQPSMSHLMNLNCCPCRNRRVELVSGKFWTNSDRRQLRAGGCFIPPTFPPHSCAVSQKLSGSAPTPSEGRLVSTPVQSFCVKNSAVSARLNVCRCEIQLRLVPRRLMHSARDHHSPISLWRISYRLPHHQSYAGHTKLVAACKRLCQLPLTRV